MDKRQFLKVTGLGIAGFVSGTAFTAPACDGVSKDKAVRYTGLVINYLKDILPLVSQLGGNDIAQLINRAIPTLEKLKDALDKADIPAAGDFFNTITGILGQIATALFQLPESTTRDTVMGILTLVNVTLRTVQLFVGDGSGIDPRTASRSGVRPVDAIRKAFEATRF